MLLLWEIAARIASAHCKFRHLGSRPIQKTCSAQFTAALSLVMVAVRNTDTADTEAALLSAAAAAGR